LEANDIAKITCECGTVLSNVEVPNDIELHVYSDKEWDKILQNDLIETWKIPLPKFDIWICPKCKRVFVFECGSNNVRYVYKLENGYE
jgi:hypothetical protein